MPSDISLVPLLGATLRALGDGGWTLTQPGLHGEVWPPDDRRVLGYRRQALTADPASAPYLLHAIARDGRLLGRIGCHEGPDEDGQVEIGYAVQRHARGRGVAGRAVDLFLQWLREQGVVRVRATVRPDNEPSLRILRRRGFAQIGFQVDDEDGLEIVFIRDLPAGRSGCAASVVSH